MQLRLNNRANARSSLARLIRDFASAPDADPEVDRVRVDRFRVLVYGMQSLLAYDKAGDADEILARLATLEQRQAEIERD